MSSVDTSTGTATASPPVKPGEMRLEVVVLAVSDVDRAKGFYEKLGWRLDADLVVDDGYRVVQLTPPGSACSIIFGTGVTSAAPGSAQGLQLSVYDIDEARADLIARGVDVSEPFHDVTGIFHHAGTEGRVDGTAPERADYGSFASFTDPDGNGWLHPGDQDPAAGPLRGVAHGHDVRVGERSRGGPEAGRRRTRQTRGAHRRGGPGLAGLVRAVHGP